MKIFGFGKSREEKAREREAKAVQDARNAEVLRQGEEMGHAIGDAIDLFMTTRAEPVGEGVFRVFAERLEKLELFGDESPIDGARGEFNLFMEQLGIFKEKMGEECRVNVAKALEVADAIGIRDDVESVISNRISTIYLELFERSSALAGDLIIDMKARGIKAVTTAHMDGEAERPVT